MLNQRSSCSVHLVGPNQLWTGQSFRIVFVSSVPEIMVSCNVLWHFVVELAVKNSRATCDMHDKWIYWVRLMRSNGSISQMVTPKSLTEGIRTRDRSMIWLTSQLCWHNYHSKGYKGSRKQNWQSVSLEIFPNFFDRKGVPPQDPYLKKKRKNKPG